MYHCDRTEVGIELGFSIQSGIRPFFNPKPIQSGCQPLDRGDCTRRFRAVSQLNSHLCLHDNCLLGCFFCPWTGAKDSLLQQHINHHFQFRQFPCSFCDVTLYSSNNRKVHEERYHEQISDRYTCPFCDFKHYSMGGIWRHKSKYHKGEDI